ncbi:MAG: iron transporter [Peptococcaceae bacterium BRH_c4b]|nr:MAG: iron transporter [Peptococcaceae bacterium BRH_c4b]
MSGCHQTSDYKEEMNTGRKKIVLAGNPNTGKSVFFNHFTGIYVDVSNYPGTTLEISCGRYGAYSVFDTPGVYGISSFNDEETVARDIILGADLVINVVSAVHLERDLFLTQQLIDTGIPVILALNMIDEAGKLGMEIDVEALADMLGVPVIPTVAIKKKGFDRLAASLIEARPGNKTPELQVMLEPLSLEHGVPQGEALLILEGDPVVAGRWGMAPGDSREIIYRKRRMHVNNICSSVVRETYAGSGFASRLSRWMIRPVTGIPILAFSLWAMYKFVGIFVAGTVVGITEGEIMLGIFEPAVRSLVGYIMPLNSLPGTILAGEFGLLTMTFTYLLGLLLPLVVAFYFMLALFEDSGYLPRIATLVDRLLTGVGLNGRGVIPIILGFGCVTMATITTRLLASDREKKIAIFLLGLTIPCSAQLGVIAGMLSGLGPEYVLLYVTVIFAVLVVSGTALNAMLPGESSHLLIDLPPLRLPRPLNIIRKTGIKSYAFLKEAAPLFAAGALIVSALQLTGMLSYIQRLLAPLTVAWLGLPPEAATAFVMGLVRRDFGAAGLSSLSLGHLQTVVALVVITLFVPCIASIMVIFKERSRGEALWIWGGSVLTAFFTGGLINQLSRLITGGNSQHTPLILAFAAMVSALGVALLLRLLTCHRKKPGYSI